MLAKKKPLPPNERLFRLFNSLLLCFFCPNKEIHKLRSPRRETAFRFLVFAFGVITERLFQGAFRIKGVVKVCGSVQREDPRGGIFGSLVDGVVLLSKVVCTSEYKPSHQRIFYDGVDESPEVFYDVRGPPRKRLKNEHLPSLPVGKKGSFHPVFFTPRHIKVQSVFLSLQPKERLSHAPVDA